MKGGYQLVQIGFDGSTSSVTPVIGQKRQIPNDAAFVVSAASPLSPGSWSCNVFVDGQQFAGAPFRVD